MRPLLKQAESKYPIIKTTPSILVRLETTLTQLNESFRKVSISIGNLLNKQNLESFRDILISGKGSLRTLESRTIPITNQAISNLNGMVNDLSSAASDIKDNPSVIIRGKAPASKLGPGER